MGCGCCLFAVLASFMPRLALFLVWVFTPYVSRAFHGSFLWPFLGLLLLPFTTLIYTFAYQPGVGVTGWGWFFVVIGVLLDLSSYGGGGYSSRQRSE